MLSLSVVRCTWLGLLRSPLWIATCLLALVLPPALGALSPFAGGPDAALGSAVGRWGILLGLVGMLAVLVRLSDLEPFLERLSPRARAWGELTSLGTATFALGIPLLAGTLLLPGRTGLSLLDAVGLAVGAAHLTVLGAWITRWILGAWGRVLGLGLATLVLPALLAPDRGAGRILVPLVDVRATISYPSSRPLAVAALAVAWTLLLALRPARPRSA